MSDMTKLEPALKTVQSAGVTSIADISLSALADMIRGNPEHDPGRYSPAEIRMAGGLVVLRAEVERHKAIAERMEKAIRRVLTEPRLLQWCKEEYDDGDAVRRIEAVLQDAIR